MADGDGGVRAAESGDFIRVNLAGRELGPRGGRSAALTAGCLHDCRLCHARLERQGQLGCVHVVGADEKVALGVERWIGPAGCPGAGTGRGKGFGQRLGIRPGGDEHGRTDDIERSRGRTMDGYGCKRG